MIEGAKAKVKAKAKAKVKAVAKPKANVKAVAKPKVDVSNGKSASSLYKQKAVCCSSTVCRGQCVV